MYRARFSSSEKTSSFARQEVSFVYVPSTRRLLLAGGRSTVQESYDPSTGSWTTVAPLPAALDHVQSVELGGVVYYIGGLLDWPGPASRFVYVYNPTLSKAAGGAYLYATPDQAFSVKGNATILALVRR